MRTQTKTGEYKMPAKLNLNSVVKSVELLPRPEGEARPADEKWARMVIYPSNWTEESGSHNVYGFSKKIHNHFDWIERIVSGSLKQYNGNVWLWTEVSPNATQKKVGIINLSDPAIMNAIEKNLETINYSIPQLGIVKLSLKNLYKITVYARIEQTFEVGYLLPMDKGDVEDCIHMVRAFLAGQKLNIDVRIRFSNDFQTFHRSVHDRAGDLKKMLDDKDFNWHAFNEAKKEEYLKVSKEVKKAKKAEIIGQMYDANPEKVSLANVIAIVNGKEMHYMETPEGEYKQVNAKGGTVKPIVRIYSNASRGNLSDIAIQEKAKPEEPRVVRLVTL